jgi:hypothetical protein
MNHCFVPVSVGELFDKYSILQIKNERITDVNKLDIIQKEINYLKPFISQYTLEPSFTIQIKAINEQLWDIEEQIREKEFLKEFDDEFINLARNVYKTNDERCRVKNKINEYLNSDIKEIKSYV